MSSNGATGASPVDRGSDLERATRQLLSQIVLDEGQAGLFDETSLEPEMNRHHSGNSAPLWVCHDADEEDTRVRWEGRKTSLPGCRQLHVLFLKVRYRHGETGPRPTVYVKQ